MSDSVIVTDTRSRAQSETYLMLLAGVLLGYAIFGRGFAYLGVPPLYIGELALLLGLIVLLRSGCLFASLATWPAVLLAVTIVWVLVRTLPHMAEYGFNAARDSVIVLYGGFAFIVIGMLLQRPRRIQTMMRLYLAFTGIFVYSWLIVAPVQFFLDAYNPFVPWESGVHLFASRKPDVATHVAGVAVFAMVGFRKTTLVWVLALVATLAMVSTSRGAMLGALVPICLAAVVLGKWRQLIVVVMCAGLLFSALYAIELTHMNDPNPHGRTVSARQLTDNVTSIVGKGSRLTENTKQWRLDWWRRIVDETIYGNYFWTGRGFGQNLAEVHGFLTEAPTAKRKTRSPHSAHMNLLARAGVPGLVLWIVLSALWMLVMVTAMLNARRHGHTDWANLFLFVICYELAAYIDASFSVALEAPMIGIWFWCLFGFGLGAVMIYRAQQLEHRDVAQREGK